MKYAALFLLLLQFGCAHQSVQACSRARSFAARGVSEYCASMDGASPEKLQSMRQNAATAKAMYLDSLTRFGCSDTAARDELKPLDACQANLDALTAQATAEAAKRRAVAGPAVAALRADERYAPARDRFRTHRQSAYAEGELSKLFIEYHIDPRDAEALGLW